ncbi:MAG: TlpA family protein disulfide reductase [Propionibacterium acidifaciens]
MPDRHDSATGPAAAAGAGARESGWARFRRSPLFTLLVLTVTAGVVIAGVWLVNHHGDQEGAITAVQVSGGSGRLVEAGQAAPDFTATTIDGRTVTLSALRGHPVWLVFEASWCASCRSEAPDVEAAHRHGAEAGLETIGLYLSEDSSDVQGYVDALGLTYAQVPDEGSRIAASFGVMGIPSHVFIDADGVVRIVHPGALSAGQMTADVNKVTGQG